MKMEIYVPFFPPSKNKTYFIGGDNLLHYTNEARNFLTDFKSYVGRTFYEAINKLGPKDTRKRLTMIFYFTKDQLETKTQTAKHPFKRVDTSGRIILTEDAFASAVGIDDLYNFDLIVMKREGYENAIKIIYEELSEHDYLKYCLKG